MVLTSNDQARRLRRKPGSGSKNSCNAGVDITLVFPLGGQPPIDPKGDGRTFRRKTTRRFRRDPAALASLANTAKLSGVSAGDCYAVFYVGGHGVMWAVP